MGGLRNQELINKICHTLINKKMYINCDTIAMLCSWLEVHTLEKILSDVGKIEDWILADTR